MTSPGGAPSVAIVHDYLTQRGGAERVVLAMAAAFPGAPVYTSLYDPEATFPDFAAVHPVTGPLDRVAPLRRWHRAALPALPWAFSRTRVDADVVLASSSGWAHGVATDGRKVVYCHSPAKWLYQPDRYLRGRLAPLRPAVAAVSSPLRRWDRSAAAGADRYLVNSKVVAGWVRDAYGIEAEVVAPPYSLDPDAPVEGGEVADGALLCVSRLLAYKNVAVVVEAMASLPDHRLVVVGTGPERAAIEAVAPPNVTLLGAVDDDALRALYRRCCGVVCPSYEDFGLVPVEAAAFATPTAALAWGGFLETVEEGVSGTFFAEPTVAEVLPALRRLVTGRWDAGAIARHAEAWSPATFRRRLVDVVAGVAA